MKTLKKLGAALRLPRQAPFIHFEKAKGPGRERALDDIPLPVLLRSCLESSLFKFSASAFEITLMDPHNTPLEVSCQNVKQSLDAGEEFLLLDCREQNEFDIAAIPDAVLLPMSQLVGRVGELEQHKNSRIVVHCHHGGRSLRVAGWLREQGFPLSQSMAGGIDAWAVEIAPGMARY